MIYYVGSLSFSDELYLQHYGVGHDKGGHSGRYPWGSGLKSAKNIVGTARKYEPAITKDLHSIVKNTSGKLHGLEHRLKTLESTYRKIKTDSEEKEISQYEAASDIKDAVRYTVLSPDEDYVNNYNAVKKNLSDLGYSELRCKNYFDLYRQGKVKHKSVQSVFTTPYGYRFEIQFQTPESQHAKDEKIPLYEERRKPGLSLQRQRYLEDKMTELAEKVPYPVGIETIKTH